MDIYKKSIIELRVHRTIENLKKNNMQGYFVETKEDVVPLVTQLVNDGDTVSVGGSMSLFECGVIDYLRSGKFKFIDRYQKGLTPDQMREVYLVAFTSDVYISSSNAITEDGVIYNVDGNSNRVAAILYGPKSVIIIVSYNKIVKNLEQAILRVKQIAAPSNCTRLSCDTYCKSKGECLSISKGKDNEMTDGCDSKGRICCNYAVSAFQRHADRIKVIIVGEELGY